MNKPVAWSYSVLDAYETCPKRYYLTKISKVVVEKQTDEMAWGNRVHKALENRLIHGTPLPENIADYEVMVAKIAAKAKEVGGVVEAEQKMALNRDYNPVTYFAKDVWVRGITDVTITNKRFAFIGDWKTGAKKPNSAQLRLTAAMTMHQKPYVEKVVNAFLWLKDGSITPETFTRADLPTIWGEFIPRVARLEHAVQASQQDPVNAAKYFPAKPSGLCRNWCPVGKKLCDHCGE